MKIVLNYDSANGFCEGMASVCRDGKWGFIDTAGREVVPCMYDGVDDFHEGMARVNVGGGWRRTDEDEPSLSGGKTGFVDKMGREVIPCQYLYADNFHDGLACVNVGLKEYGFIDKTGQVVIRDVGITEFSEGFARVWCGNQAGYMDKTGQMAIPARFDRAFGFHDGLALVRENRTWGFIDKTGQMVIEYHTEPAPEPPKFSVPDEDLPF